MFIYLFIWLHQLQHGGSLLWSTDSEAIDSSYRLSCSEANEVFIPPSRIEPMSPALEGGFLTTDPSEKALRTALWVSESKKSERNHLFLDRGLGKGDSVNLKKKVWRILELFIFPFLFSLGFVTMQVPDKKLHSCSGRQGGHVDTSSPAEIW